MTNDHNQVNDTGNGDVIRNHPSGDGYSRNNNQEVVTMSQDVNKLTEDEALYANVIEADRKRGQGGDSVMSSFRDKLFMILDRIDKDPKVSPKQIKAGAVANALKGLFVKVDVNNQYGRSYRYLKQMGQTLRTKGRELKAVNGTQMIVKSATAAASVAKPEGAKAAAGA